MTLRAVPKPAPRAPREPKRLRSKPHRIPVNVRLSVKQRDSYTCAWCGVPGGALDIHHRLPRSRGGRDVREHCVSVHRTCHRRIHEQSAEGLRRGFLVHSADELDKPVEGS